MASGGLASAASPASQSAPETHASVLAACTPGSAGPGTPSSSASSSNTAGSTESTSQITHALTMARQESDRLQRRIRYPALLIGSVLMGCSMWWVYTSWTSRSSASLLVRDFLRSAGCISWLCACLPSDHYAPKIGSLMLFLLGVKCTIWHTRTAVIYMQQLPAFYDDGSPCYIEDEETDCVLGACTIGSVSAMWIMMHLWQLPYLAFGIRLPPRATTARLWVALAWLHLTKGATDFLVLLPAMVIKADQTGIIPYAALTFTTLHGIYATWMGFMLRWPRFRQWVHFSLLSLSGDLTAASGIAAFLGKKSPKNVMEVAQGACRYVSMDKLTQEDMRRSTPDATLQVHSTPCRLQDVDAFFSHSWHDPADLKWEALQAWRKSFKAQHQREPRLWIDKYCIDQTNIEASLMCLPVFLAGCHTLLIIAGPTYLSRLWCVEEIFVYLQMGRPVQSIELIPLCPDMDSRIANFDVEDAQCFLQVDREKLLATIEAGCDKFEAFNVQVHRALKHALKNTEWPMAE